MGLGLVIVLILLLWVPLAIFSNIGILAANNDINHVLMKFEIPGVPSFYSA